MELDCEKYINMDYRKSAAEILENIGGKENIVSAAHCATRLRMVIADNDKANRGALENVGGVKGVFEASGQLQIILGTGVVNKVYDELIGIAGIASASKEDVKKAAAGKGNPFQRFIKTLGDIFVPIIPAIVASGFLMGIMETLNFLINNGYLALSNESSLFVLANMFANTAYVFLPVLIGFSAAKVFGGNSFLGGVIGMIMVHPNLQNAWTMTGGVEKFLHKHVPAMFDLFVTPLVSVFVTGFLTMTMIGPVFNFVESGIINGIQALISIPFGIGSLVMGTLYAPTVVTGIHHMYTIIDLGQIKEFGVTYWLPLASAANNAQGAAALAVALKTKDQKLKSMALPSSLSAFMGITEPAIFGVNMRFFKPFVCACIGGGCGAMFASVTSLGATGTGVTGIFGILLCLNAPVKYILMFLISAGAAFVLTWMFGYQNSKPEENVNDKAVNDKAVNDSAEEFTGNGTLSVSAPVSGKVVSLDETGDATFAAEILGKGAAIEPSEGKVYAPFDATVISILGHAIGLEGKNGVRILIHIGIDTVNLNGKYYTAHCAEGQEIKAGDLLMEFNMEKIQAEGYKTITPVVVVNTEKYKDVQVQMKDAVCAGEQFLTIYE